MSSLSAGLGLSHTAIIQYLSALSIGNFSLFCEFQNNFRFLGQIAVLLDVDAAADVVADWRRETDGVLGLFVLGECDGHVRTLHVRKFLLTHGFIIPYLSALSSAFL